MKIVIYVDYSNKEFNKDFQMSNSLIAKGHNVFFAINNVQFDELRGNCDLSLLGVSALVHKDEYKNVEILNDDLL